MRKLLFAPASLSLLVGGAPCKDAKGRFTKCPPRAPTRAGRCKSANGKFAKCGTAGAKPVDAHCNEFASPRAEADHTIRNPVELCSPSSVRSLPARTFSISARPCGTSRRWAPRNRRLHPLAARRK
jgi:hypothetical protein